LSTSPRRPEEFTSTKPFVATVLPIASKRFLIGESASTAPPTTASCPALPEATCVIVTCSPAFAKRSLL